MMQPLINNEAEPICQESIQFNKKKSIISIPFTISERDVQKLNSGSYFLNIFFISPGENMPAFEEIEIFVGGSLFKIKNNQYNKLEWSKIYRQQSFDYKKHKNSFHETRFKQNISITLSHFEGTRVLYLYLARELESSMLFQNTYSRTDTKVGTNLKTRTLRNMLNMSKGNTVPLSISVLCNLQLTLMTHPGKGLHCKHADFFCIKNYLTMNLAKQNDSCKWLCPYCERKVYFSELFLDQFMQETINKYKEYFIGDESDLSTSKEMMEDELRQSEVTKTEKSYKLYLLNGEILTSEDLRSRIDAYRLSTRQLQTNIQPIKDEGWANLLGNSSKMRIENPNSRKIIKNKIDVVEVSEMNIEPEFSNSRFDSRQKKSVIESTPNSGNFSLKKEVEEMTSSLLKKSSEHKNQVDSPNSTGIGSKILEGLREVEVNLNHSSLREHPNAQTPSSSKSKFENFSSSSSRIINELDQTSINGLRGYPSREKWTAEFITRHVDARKDCSPIIATIPRDMRKMTSMIFVVCFPAGNEQFDLEKFIKYAWFIGQNIDPCLVSMYFGQFISHLCSLFSMRPEFPSALIKFLKEKSILQSFSPDLWKEITEFEPNIIERLAQFIFGWCSQVSAEVPGTKSLGKIPTTLIMVINSAKFVLSEVFNESKSMDRSKFSIQVHPSIIFQQRAIVLVCRYLSLFILRSQNINSETEEREILNELCKGLVNPKLLCTEHDF